MKRLIVLLAVVLFIVFCAAPSSARFRDWNPQGKSPWVGNGRVAVRVIDMAREVASMKRERRRIENRLDQVRPSPEKVELGRLLFFDKVLSGNENISCASCHHSFASTGDGLTLPVGEGGNGFGMTRDTGEGFDAIERRVPRNSPHVFNLGLAELGYFPFIFWDGRIELAPDLENGFISPAGEDLPMGLDNVLAAQAVFPVTSAEEMAGQPGENPVANAAHAGNLAGEDGVWNLLVERLRQIPEYVELFAAAFPDVNSASDLSIVHVANSIAAFEFEFGLALNSPFDRFLLGEKSALSFKAKKGMALFYGKANCAGCHYGVLQTDNAFHSVAMPQVGPGKGNGRDGYEDFGRENVTGNETDRFKFRTPTLRNVVVTGPWGHAGAYNELEAVIEHKTDPIGALDSYDRDQVALPSRDDLDATDFLAMDSPLSLGAIMDSNQMPVIRLNDHERECLIEFLEALTDPGSLDLRRFVPGSVPSGLTVFD